ncbi:MAG: DNA polymerase I [Oscillospiraceae bacterium]|nr:DNA polymerase I [Oscillospiraceae bacterium]
MENRELLLLVDGNSILNRAYFAFKNQGRLMTSDGFPTNAIFGFLNILFKYFDDEKPTHICVAFDLKAPTFRHLEYDGYKAKRKGMPDDLAEQLQPMKDILAALGVTISECEGYEADDILGTLTKIAEDSDVKSVVLTGDRDALQLVSDNTTVKIPVTRSGRTDTEEYDRAAFEDKYGIPPELFIDVKGLMGDSSDNIPGVAGIGEKTAFELVRRFGGIDSIYQNIDNIEKKGVKEKIAAGKEMAYLSRRLSEICRTAPCGLELIDLVKRPEDKKRLYKIFKRLEFRSYIIKMNLGEGESESEGEGRGEDEGGGETQYIPPGRGVDQTKQLDFLSTESEQDSVLSGSFVQGNESSGQDDVLSTKSELIVPYESTGCTVLNSIPELGAIIDKFSCANVVSIYPIFEKRGRIRELHCVGISFYSPGRRSYYADVDKLDSLDVLRSLYAIFAHEDACAKTDIVVHDVKQIYLWLMINGYNCPSVDFDTMLGGYLADASSGKYGIADLAFKYLDRQIASLDELTGKGRSKRELCDVSVEELSEFAVSSARTIYDLTPILKKEIQDNGQDSLYFDVELPLSEVLAFMEFKGIAVDREGLKKFSGELDVRISQLTSQILELAGEDFNINSTKQLGIILYEKLGLKPVKKTKTGYSTDIDALEGLIGKHEIIDKIIEYRQHTKLKSTYADGLSELVNTDTGRIYSTFNQAVTATGRISSTEPNLQNIPVKLELGREIRKLFIPGGDEFVLMSADYSQIELRVLAHISEDENMIGAFMAGEDIHTDTASKVFGAPPSEVTKQMRGKAKAVNFGIVYGIGEFSLAKDINVSRWEARNYIESYLAKYHGVRKYMSDSVNFAKEHGYAVTMMNRRRNLPELQSPNYNIRAFGERVAMNTPIQGSAADIIKIAMVKVYREMKGRNLKSALILQVHDELIIEAHRDEIEIASGILKDAMENAVSMSAPLVAEVSIGENWKELK